MESPVVQTEFDAVSQEGREFVISVEIGDQHNIPTKSGDTDVGFYIEVEPIMERRRQGGTDSFMAMCFSIQLVRKALIVFVSHGGSLYARGTRSPIDLQSSWFESLGGLIRPEYLRPDQTPPQNGG
jgi:hypothetical protein